MCENREIIPLFSWNGQRLHASVEGEGAKTFSFLAFSETEKLINYYFINAALALEKSDDSPINPSGRRTSDNEKVANENTGTMATNQSASLCTERVIRMRSREIPPTLVGIQAISLILCLSAFSISGIFGRHFESIFIPCKSNSTGSSNKPVSVRQATVNYRA